MLPLSISENTRARASRLHPLSSRWPWYISGGIIAVAFLPALYLAQWGIAAIVLSLLLWRLSRYRHTTLAALLFVFGALWGSLDGYSNLHQSLPEALIRQDVLASGTLVDSPANNRRSLRFTFDINSLSYQGNPQPYKGRVILNCYRPCPAFKAGQSWRLTLRLKPAHGSLNPGAFNYAQWLFAQRIRATGYVRTPMASVATGKPGITSRVTQLRADIRHFITSQPLAYGGILSALAVGIREGISESRWQVFRNTGTAHLIAISGLHIGMVAAIAYFLGKLLWRHTLLQRSQIPEQFAGRLSAIVAAAIYAALAGFALPTLRALLMLLAYFSMLSLRRNPGISFSLGMVLMLVLVFDPLASLGASLWLSFGAVAAIALATRPTAADSPLPESAGPSTRVNKVRCWLAKWWQVQWGVFLGLLPISLLFFQQISLVSLAANFIAIPVVAMLVVPLILLSLMALLIGLNDIAAGLLKLADILLSGLWPLLESLSQLPISILVAGTPPAWALLLSLGAVLIMLTPGLGSKRHLAAIGLLPLFISLPGSWPSGRFEAQVLDVGQGMSVLIQTGGHSLLYDAGARYDSGFDSGKAIVIPLLRNRGVRQLDTAIVSHNNLDHYGGMNAVLTEMPANRVYSSRGFFSGSQPCIQGQRWEWDGVQFEILHPMESPNDNKNGSDGNNASCVLKISSRYGSLLIPGDIEIATENRLVRELPEKISNIDVLLAPHHGSNTSSSQPFIGISRPRLVVVSAGYLNRFGHPAKKVLARYKKYDTPYLNTANTGWINLRFSASGIETRPWRALYRRYWLEDVGGVTPHSIRLKPQSPEAALPGQPRSSSEIHK